MGHSSWFVPLRGWPTWAFRVWDPPLGVPETPWDSPRGVPEGVSPIHDFPLPRACVPRGTQRRGKAKFGLFGVPMGALGRGSVGGGEPWGPLPRVAFGQTTSYVGAFLVRSPVAAEARRSAQFVKHGCTFDLITFKKQKQFHLNLSFAHCMY